MTQFTLEKRSSKALDCESKCVVACQAHQSFEFGCGWVRVWAKHCALTLQAADVAGTTELVTAMVEICYEAKDWPRLSETISMLSKRRAQLKQAVGAMVQLASKWVEELTDEEAKLQLIETLRAVSEGKMFVEVDRARLTKMLATIHESKGDLAQV